MIKKVLPYLLIAILIYFIITKLSKRSNKYYKYFNKSLGFGTDFLDKFSKEELTLSYNYLVNYPRKGITLKREDNPSLYDSLKAINEKHNYVFNSIK